MVKSDEKKLVRTRFAPSPTGYMHVGNLRSALYSYLIAKKTRGKFVLRIEDTDKARQVENGIEIILKSLYWAGLEPDEGVCLDKAGKVAQKGKFGPYIQSERLGIYQKYAEELLDKGQAYYCFCSAERLEQVRELQQKNKLPTGYDGECLKLFPEEAKKRVRRGESHVVRLKMPKEGEMVLTDLIRGEVKFQNKLVDDQVLIKSDGFPTYHLAVVVDDHLMEITHVVRGEEWISSAPKHLQLYKYFGWEIPKLAHLPLLLNADKSKLSKRQGDVAVEDYRAKGYLPEAIINFIAFLGWNPGGERELFTLEELVQEFSLDKVSKAGAVFNLEKLNWFNKQYIKKLSDQEIAERSLEWFEDVDKNVLNKAIVLERERVTTLAELPEAVGFVFELPDYPEELLVWKKGTFEEAKKILSEAKILLNTKSVQWDKVELEKLMGEWIKERGYSTGSVLWPLRVALSGQQNSPGPFEIAEVLGKDESLKRINLAVEKL